MRNAKMRPTVVAVETNMTYAPTVDARTKLCQSVIVREGSLQWEARFEVSPRFICLPVGSNTCIEILWRDGT